MLRQAHHERSLILSLSKDAISAVSAVKRFFGPYLALDQNSSRLAVPEGMPVR